MTKNYWVRRKSMLLCAKYIVPVSSEPMENGAVLVRDGAIADIGTAEMMRLRYPDEEVKDELLSVDNSSKFTVFNSGSGVFRTGDSTGVSMVPNLIS